MKTKELIPFIAKIESSTVDNEGENPIVKQIKICSKNALDITYYHGISKAEYFKLQTEIRNSIKYPCIFNNHKGGGIVDSFFALWV